jgi:hypothetical protein
MHQSIQDQQGVCQRLAAAGGRADAQVAAGAAAACQLAPHSRLDREQLGVAPACSSSWTVDARAVVRLWVSSAVHDVGIKLHGCSSRTGAGLLPACPSCSKHTCAGGPTCAQVHAKLLLRSPDRAAAISWLRPCTCAREVPSCPSKETGTRIHGSAAAGAAAGSAATADMAEVLLQPCRSYRVGPTLCNLYMPAAQVAVCRPPLCCCRRAWQLPGRCPGTAHARGYHPHGKPGLGLRAACLRVT